MDRQELEMYEYQHAQVKLALAQDPTNEEMLSLQAELGSLIELGRQLHGVDAPAPTASTSSSSAPKAKPKPKPTSTTAGADSNANPTASSSSSSVSHAVTSQQHNLKSGDACLARYSGDSKFYPARITSIGGADAHRVYSVVFQGYDSTEIVSAGDIKPMTDSKKRALELSAEEVEKEKRRKKNEKKNDTREVKAAEQVSKQKSWQSFAKKGAKKGGKNVIPGLSGTSMFKSPEDVGVVGSGRGMSASVERKRQTFRDD